MAADPLTTIPVRESTRAELQRLKSGGQSYDDLIRAILEELEEQDPWFKEMEQRLEDIHSGKAKLEPIESLYEKYPPSRTRARSAR
jgi:predicted CopG family antitoxin